MSNLPFEMVVRWRAHDGMEHRLLARRRSYDNFGRLPPKEYVVETLYRDVLGNEAWRANGSDDLRAVGDPDLQLRLSFIDLAYQAGRKEGAK